MQIPKRQIFNLCYDHKTMYPADKYCYECADKLKKAQENQVKVKEPFYQFIRRGK